MHLYSLFINRLIFNILTIFQIYLNWIFRTPHPPSLRLRWEFRFRRLMIFSLIAISCFNQSIIQFSPSSSEHVYADYLGKGGKIENYKCQNQSTFSFRCSYNHHIRKVGYSVFCGSKIVFIKPLPQELKSLILHVPYPKIPNF